LLQQELDLLQERENTWKTGKATRLLQIQTERDEQNFLPDLRQQLSQVSHQIATLAYDQGAHNELRQQVQVQADAEKSWHDLQIAQNSSLLLQAELESMLNEIKRDEESLVEAESHYEQESAALEQARSESQDSRSAEEELASLREDQDVFNRRLGEIDQALATIQTQRERQVRLRQEMEALNEIIRQYSKLETAFGKDGVPAMLIEQALPELEDQANELLARRAGARLQTLVIDEGFGNQDAQGRQRLIEAINAVRPDFQKVLIITHLEELKDYFSNRIEVIKTPSGSQAEVLLG
jgi:exonuclease SbcC